MGRPRGREVELLHAESLGLQDVLTEAGAEAAGRAAQLAAMERHLAEADSCIDRACPSKEAYANSVMQAPVTSQGLMRRIPSCISRSRSPLSC